MACLPDEGRTADTETNVSQAAGLDKRLPRSGAGWFTCSSEPPRLSRTAWLLASWAWQPLTRLCPGRSVTPLVQNPGTTQ